MQQITFILLTLISMNSMAGIRLQDCELDHSKFCQNTKIDSDEFWNCLKKKKAELYGSCKTQINHYDFHVMCKNDIESQCKEAMTAKNHSGEVHSCIYKASHSKKGVTKKCRSFMDKNPSYFNSLSEGLVC